jgi:hypothetical protein
MQPLFVVLHSPPDTGKVKVIGIYSTEPGAQAAAQRARDLPGFVDDADSFTVHRYEIDKDHWPRGFVRL